MGHFERLSAVPGYYVYGRRALAGASYFPSRPATQPLRRPRRSANSPNGTQSKQPEESAPATAPDGPDFGARVRPAHGKRRGSAKTVDEAIDIALEDLGLKRSQVDIEVLTPGKPGLSASAASRRASVSPRS